MITQKRREDLSNKFEKMGHALIQEGFTLSDENILQSGTILIILSNLILNDSDMFIFGEICTMFSAKKIIDDMESKGEFPKDEILNFFKNNSEPETPKRKKRKGGKDKNSDENVSDN
jgi:hypothetical protein